MRARMKRFHGIETIDHSARVSAHVSSAILEEGKAEPSMHGMA